jgi:hypothetical protein
VEVVIRVRHDQPVHVDEVHQEDPRGAEAAGRLPALRVTRQHQEEREEEVPEHQDDADGAPAVLLAVLEEQRLFRDVRVPDEEVLAEADVRPEHREREHQLADVVKVLGRDRVAQQLRRRESRVEQHEERHHADDRAGEQVDAEHRRVPLGVERHEPVDARERQRQREQGHPRGGELVHRDGELRVSRLVLLVRPRVQARGEEDDDREVDARARRPEREVQEAVLGRDRRVVRRLAEPRVQVVAEDDDRDEQAEEHRQHAHQLLGAASDRDAPAGAREVLQHHEEQPAHAQREAPREGRQIREREALRILQVARAGHRCAEHAERREDLPHAGPRVVRRHHVRGCGLTRRERRLDVLLRGGRIGPGLFLGVAH